MSGKRLPNVSKLLSLPESAVDATAIAERERYGQTVLVMFIPWQQLKDLLIDTDQRSWWQAYLRHFNDELFPPYALHIMANMESYYAPDCTFNGDTPLHGDSNVSDSEDSDSDEGGAYAHESDDDFDASTQMMGHLQPEE
jgi:hypothetical protein